MACGFVPVRRFDLLRRFAGGRPECCRERMFKLCRLPFKHDLSGCESDDHGTLRAALAFEKWEASPRSKFRGTTGNDLWPTDDPRNASLRRTVGAGRRHLGHRHGNLLSAPGRRLALSARPQPRLRWPMGL